MMCSKNLLIKEILSLELNVIMMLRDTFEGEWIAKGNG